jgi:ubiquinone/menaquinone biosynthesis C-methylase UbiE
MSAILGSDYVGAKAKGYDAKRAGKKKWKDEHEIIHMMMKDLKPGTTVLDVPVGTGRLLKFFQGRGFKVTGVDVSQDMLALAGKLKCKNVVLVEGDAQKLKYEDMEFDAVVCLRLLHLVDEKAMKAIVKELTRVASHIMILTIQLGEGFRSGGDTATHDDRQFRALLKRLGWNITEDRKITGAGWHVMRLDR